jgi:hypothetical protein
MRLNHKLVVFQHGRSCRKDLGVVLEGQSLGALQREWRRSRTLGPGTVASSNCKQNHDKSYSLFHDLSNLRVEPKAPRALWSAAACCCFSTASLLEFHSSGCHAAVHAQQAGVVRVCGQQAGLRQNGSKLPHSKALRA